MVVIVNVLIIIVFSNLTGTSKHKLSEGNDNDAVFKTDFALNTYGYIVLNRQNQR